MLHRNIGRLPNHRRRYNRFLWCWIGASRVIIVAVELGTRVNKVWCLSTQVCGCHIELLWDIVAHNYMCCHMAKHTYVEWHIYVCSIHILYIFIGRNYSLVYMSCMFVFSVIMPRYIYIYIYIGCSCAPASPGLCPDHQENQQLSIKYQNLMGSIISHELFNKPSDHNIYMAYTTTTANAFT